MCEPATGEIVACTSQKAGMLGPRGWALAGTGLDDTIVVPGSDFARVGTLAQASCARTLRGATTATAATTAQQKTSARRVLTTDSSPSDASTPAAARRARCGSRSDR